MFEDPEMLVSKFTDYTGRKNWHFVSKNIFDAFDVNIYLGLICANYPPQDDLEYLFKDDMARKLMFYHQV